MDDVLREQLITQFREYLEEVDDPSSAGLHEETPSTDQFSLFTELVGLKNEVKRESRQVKDALDEFKEVFTTLRGGYDTLSQELARRQAREQEQQQEILRPLLLQLLELHDRLEAAVAAAPPTRRFTSWLCQTEQRWIASMREGQRMSLRRLNNVLADYQVRVMQTLGRPLDPHTMRVVETEHRSEIADGVVVAEQRKGFMWEDRLLRSAEVKVNKLEKEPNT